MLLRFGVIILALTAYAFATEDECEVHLRTSFAGAIAVGYKRQQLQLEQIEALAASPVPYNPLQYARPTTRNGMLKHTLEANVRALAPGKWPAVQSELRAFVAGVKRKEGISQEAKVDTAKLFLPSVAGSFIKDRFNESDTGAFAYTNEQNHLVGVSIRGPSRGFIGSERSFLEINDLSSPNSKPVSLQLGVVNKASFSAWATPEKHLRAAYISSADELKVLAYPDTENSLTIPLGDDPRLPLAASTVSKPLITKEGRRLIAVANRGRLQVLDLDNPKEPLFTWTNDYGFPDPRLFQTSKGKILIAFKEDRLLRAFEIGGAMLLTQNRPTTVASAEWWESREGEIYLSSLSGSEYKVYKPFNRDQQTYFEKDLLPAGRSENFWFRGHDGHDYNYVMTSARKNGVTVQEITTFDVTAKQKKFSRESANFMAGSPVVSGGVHGDPRVVLYNGTSGPGLFSVINPIDEGYQTIEIQLEVPNNAIGFQGITKFTNPAGEEALLLSDRHAAAALNLFNKILP